MKMVLFPDSCCFVALGVIFSIELGKLFCSFQLAKNFSKPLEMVASWVKNKKKYEL